VAQVVLHISEAEAASDFDSVLARVRREKQPLIIRD
jgi:hypothetical protein